MAGGDKSVGEKPDGKRPDGEQSGSRLRIKAGTEYPAGVNPAVAGGSRRKRKQYSAAEYLDGILKGSRTILSQAITLVESSLPEHAGMMRDLVESCLPFSGKSVRVGITGVPGAGKSSFIEALGLHLVSEGRKVAVLAVDPSSSTSRGRILGDKTRMEKLGTSPDAFIRPSPAAGSAGGVARKTREAIILCEAAGFDTILVETVGVGQSETAVHSMVDFFLLLVLAGAGDELQGMKRGIMEMADAVAVTKADGSNRSRAEHAVRMYRNVLSLFPADPSGWKPVALSCSVRENTGIRELWDVIRKYVALTGENGFFTEKRKLQSVMMMNETIAEYLNNSFYSNDEIRALKLLLEKELLEGRISSNKAALSLIEKYQKIHCR